LVQVGPISYDYFTFRKNVTFSGNGTVRYRNFQQFFLNESRSHMDENETIICINAPFVAITSILGMLEILFFGNFMILLIIRIFETFDFWTFQKICPSTVSLVLIITGNIFLHRFFYTNFLHQFLLHQFFFN